MVPVNDGDGHGLVLALVLLEDAPEVGLGTGQNARLLRSLDLHAVEGHILGAGVRVPHHAEAGAHIGSSVPLPDDVDGDAGHVHVGAFPDHLLHRPARDDGAGAGALAYAPGVLLDDLLLGYPEGEAEMAPVGGRLGQALPARVALDV